MTDIPPPHAPVPHPRHAYACAKRVDGMPKCESWCGKQERCISTLSYKEPYMQMAYERGYRDALDAETKDLVNSTSPHGVNLQENLLQVALDALAEAVEEAGGLGHPLCGASERRAARESLVAAQTAIRALAENCIQAPKGIRRTDALFWLEHRGAIVEALAERGLQVVSNSGRVWLALMAGSPKD